MARSCFVVLLAVCTAFACTSVTKDPTLSGSASVIAVFSPNADDACLSDLPFPTDLARDPYTGLMNIPYCLADSADTIAVKTALRGLDGYAVTTGISFRFSDTVDESTLAGNVTLFEASTGTAVAATPYYFENRNHMVALLHSPLKPGTAYVVVVKNAILDLELQPIVGDQAFTFLKSETPLIDDKRYSTTAALADSQATALEQVRLAYQPLLAAAIGATGWSREQIALAWGFTTTSETYAHMPELAASVRGAGQVAINHDTAVYARDHLLLAASGLPYDKICSVHTGHVRLKSVLGADDMLALKADGTPRLSDISVDYVMTIPKVGATCDLSDPPPDPIPPIPAWDLSKVVVFAHGLGRCRNDALAVANSLASVGYAVLSLDGPHAGSRMLNPLGDQDMDGCPDQPATPELIAVGTHDPNPFVLRDALRQWGLELVQVIEAIEGQPWAFTNDAIGVTPEVAVVGHSWGGIAATLAAPLAVKTNVPIVRALVTSATPAGFGDIFAPLITAKTAAALPAGSSPDAIAMAAAQSISVFGWALEPADPQFAVSTYPTSMAVLNQVIETGTTDVLLHGTADQDRLRAAFGRQTAAQATFTVAPGGSLNICSPPELAVGSLLKPCVASTSANYGAALTVYAGMQKQLVTFVAAHAVCAAPCP